MTVNTTSERRATAAALPQLTAPASSKGRHDAEPPRPYRHRMTGAQQMQRHRPAHDAEADEAKLHQFSPRRQPLEQLEDGNRILLAETRADHRVVHLRRRRRHWQAQAQLVRALHDDVHVLLMHPGLEAGLEVAVEHALAVILENLRIGETAEQRFAHPGRVDAAPPRS
jgi:hypothetical protein